MTDEEIQKTAAWIRSGRTSFFTDPSPEPRQSWQDQYRERYDDRLAKIAAGDYCQHCKLLSPGDDHECLGVKLSRPIRPAGLKIPFMQPGMGRWTR